MTGAWRALFTVAAGAWIVALGAGGIAICTPVRRRGRGAAWPAARTPMPATDLAGAWLGFFAAVALLAVRRGSVRPRAVALGLVALVVAASLALGRAC